GLHAFALGQNLVLHWMRNVVFSVDDASCESDGRFRYNFFDENDAAAEFTVHFPVDIEAQIHFFEFAMKRDSDPSPQFCFAKTKPDKAKVCFALKRPQSCACGNKRQH